MSSLKPESDPQALSVRAASSIERGCLFRLSMFEAALLKEEMLSLTALRVEADCRNERDLVFYKRAFFKWDVRPCCFAIRASYKFRGKCLRTNNCRARSDLQRKVMPIEGMVKRLILSIRPRR